MATKKKSKSKNSSSRMFFFGVVGLAIICFIGIMLLSNIQKTDVSNTSAATFDYQHQPYLGQKNAPVKMVEFGDYKCPICKNFNDTVFPAIDKELIQTGKVQFYFMNDPFIYTDSTRAALFAETVFQELGNDAFWKFHDQLYSEQPSDSKYEKIDLYSTSFLEKTLSKVVSQTDSEKVAKAFKIKKYQSTLDKDTSYVNQLGISGTPTFFVNGQQFNGNSYQDLIDMVNKAATEN
ncbi:thioredoxin domain-containing protein [Bacillus sp. ISL-18]|uniref:DsbA family protein n=1 Tax=Bacillus sp. ISL-18 TaxID=2819118 RepID=UPI001BEBEA4C|nr:thioredoxin domain-containing protein [Bacillus sp. ISL-18]MBT2655994.1 thioredoxin domain-containing protein [Bacillus sp. ISL-18]